WPSAVLEKAGTRSRFSENVSIWEYRTGGSSVMDDLRGLAGFSLQELELGLFQYAARTVAQWFVQVLEEPDHVLLRSRDRRRYRLKGMETRTLQTLFGVDVTFHRRRYVDRTTRQSVSRLDQALKLRETTTVRPGACRLCPATRWSATRACGKWCWPWGKGWRRSRPSVWRRLKAHASCRSCSSKWTGSVCPFREATGPSGWKKNC